MITKEYLQEKGFRRDYTSPSSVEDYFRKEKTERIYIKVRFKGDVAVGLFAYTENEHINIRKVVLSDTVVTEDDLENAIKICHL